MTLLGIREAVVATADLPAAVAFLRRAFGFEVVEETDGGALLAAAGAPAGRLRLVAQDAVPQDAAAWDLGVRLLGIYSRDLEQTVEAIESAGGASRRPVSYPYGAATLSELVGYGRDGVWWTVPQAVTGAHRPSDAYAADPQRLHSELHSVVLVVDDHDDAVAFFEAGGLGTVFDGTMAGSEFEELVGMPAGAELRLTFMGGPEHRPARLEIMSFTGVAGQRTDAGGGVQRIVYFCDDVAATREALIAAGAEQADDGTLRGPAGLEIALVQEENR
ncbi:VOC family protein [Mumia zhuanghuii]|uniref:VOC family protein n=1 Tax=Mumia zhuanghuii TaxID=2585211 RepID=UPI0036365252